MVIGASSRFELGNDIYAYEDQYLHLRSLHQNSMSVQTFYDAKSSVCLFQGG